MESLESKFLSKFKKLNELASDTFKLNGSRIFVEVLDSSQEVKTAGGIIIAQPKDMRVDRQLQKPVIAIVLQCGRGYYDEDNPEKEIPLEYVPGNVVMIADAGLRYYSVFPGLGTFTENKLAMTLESEVLMSWPSLEEYKKYSEILANA